MKQKRYWLRGGVITGILGPIIWFCILKLTISASVNVIEFPFAAGLVLGLIIYGSAAVLGFIVGSIIGWVYGKVKRRKHVGITKN